MSNIGKTARGDLNSMDVGVLWSEMKTLEERAKRAEAKADALGSRDDLMAAIVQLSSQVRELTATIEEKVNAAIDAKLPQAIQDRSVVIQENILQSMTVELNCRIAERTAHFATQDAVVSVDGRVAAVQAELAVFKSQVARFARAPALPIRPWKVQEDEDLEEVQREALSKSHRASGSKG